MKVTIRDLLDQGAFSLDDEVDHCSFWYDGAPVDPDMDVVEFAAEGCLSKGDTFAVQPYISFPERQYIVTADSGEECDGEYKVERVEDTGVQ